MKKLIVILSLLCLTGLLLAQEEAPTQQNPTSAAKAMIYYMKEYRNPVKLKGEALKKSLEIKKQLSQILDIRKMGRLAMQAHWKKMKESEKSDFYRYFVPIVEKLAFSGNHDYFSGDNLKIKFYKTKKISLTKVCVYSTIYEKANDMLLHTDYIMYKNKKTGNWSIGNIFVDGSSLVRDYKNQFNKIIRKWNKAKLVLLMKNKLVEIEKKGL